jgi:hypothetical protein
MPDDNCHRYSIASLIFSLSLFSFASWLSYRQTSELADERIERSLDVMQEHFIVLAEEHLRHILRAYARYYNEIRTHNSLNKDAPASRPVQRTGNIRSLPILDGLHHQYVRV